MGAIIGWLLKTALGRFVGGAVGAALTSCGTTGPTTKVEKPPRPRISQAYENLLLQAPPSLQKEAQKHEWDWHGYADKMEMRAGYR